MILEINLLLPSLVLTIVLGVLFYFVSLRREKIHLHPSIIAGFSIAYFFLVVLPEIALFAANFPINLPMLDFFFLFLGFVFVHVLEKLIVQRVDAKTQEEARAITLIEKDMELIEKQMAEFLADGLKEEKLDKSTSKNLAETIAEMRIEGKKFQDLLEDKKKKIHDDINKYLDDLRVFKEVFYHALIGIIFAGLMILNIISGVLFYSFAFLMLVMSHDSSKKRIFSDLDIEYEPAEKGRLVFLTALSAPFGIVAGIIFELVFQIRLEFVNLMFAFVSGVILYNIVREVIPEKEKGKIQYFLIAIVASTILIFLIYLIEYSIFTH